MLTIQQIINEVDTLVPNIFDAQKKLTWVNEINKEFFEIVKIPVVHSFTVSPGLDNTLPSDVRSRNIDRVQVADSFYLSLQYGRVNPGHNHWFFDDITKTITLNPPPSLIKSAIVIYHKISTKTFLIASIGTDSPEAPEEYHWIYVLGLAERVAKAMNDVSLANNFGDDYISQLSIAQQNYGKEG
jgi:hypothetical protein